MKLNEIRHIGRIGLRLTQPPLQGEVFPPGAEHKSPRQPQLFHSIECFLENFEIAGVAYLFPRVLNPLLLQ